MSKILSKEVVMEWILILIIFSFMSAIGNYIGYHYPFQESLYGMFILCAITLLGLIIEHHISYNIPAIIYISIIGLIVALPWSPISSTIIYYTSKVNIVSLTTILLAYAGIAMGKDLGEFKKVGLKGIIVTFFVILGTYMGSALIAQGVLMYTGMI
ncbi:MULTISPECIES: hypothetical protein [Methanosphaera]|uniref:DUF340 domain-containing protein n=3 Tax=Methanobacteriaceae TaxID=2159 RepID=A0A328Q2D5_9EURY|nr:MULTISPECIES: hypothetical protein [Methanosphaera]ABC57078.1 conserved hypothetical membrane-spanning protein [Methanosphaera stadtmanae DSM 3091]MDO5821805.1 hypothetical protein [Methanosphaera sp.]RAP03214.1 hypothetical protein CA615_03300 [Methanosphaera stadtmanae]